MTAALVPAGPLITMAGPPCSGKSTWAAGRFPHDQLFGLDMFRRILAGDVADMSATGPAGDMLGALVSYRMRTGRTTVVDATNVNAVHRRGLLRRAWAYRRPTVAVVMHTPLAVCLARNANRGPAAWPGANDRPLTDTKIIVRMHATVTAAPPHPGEFDLVVHVHPDDATVAYAYPGAGRTVDWCLQLLAAGRWGAGITLLADRAEPLPWTPPINPDLAEEVR